MTATVPPSPLPGDAPDLDAPRVYVIIVPGHPLSANKLAAAGLTKRLADKKHYREVVAWESRRLYPGPPFPHAEVTYTLVRPDDDFYKKEDAAPVVYVLEGGLCAAHNGTFLRGNTEADVTTIIRQARGMRREVRIEIRGPLPRPMDT